MTKHECAVVMAHTGICMLTDKDFGIFHEYVENIMGRPVPFPITTTQQSTGFAWNTI